MIGKEDRSIWSTNAPATIAGTRIEVHPRSGSTSVSSVAITLERTNRLLPGFLGSPLLGSVLLGSLLPRLSAGGSRQRRLLRRLGLR